MVYGSAAGETDEATLASHMFGPGDGAASRLGDRPAKGARPR